MSKEELHENIIEDRNSDGIPRTLAINILTTPHPRGMSLENPSSPHLAPPIQDLHQRALGVSEVWRDEGQRRTEPNIVRAMDVTQRRPMGTRPHYVCIRKMQNPKHPFYTIWCLLVREKLLPPSILTQDARQVPHLFARNASDFTECDLPRAFLRHNFCMPNVGAASPDVIQVDL